MFSRISKIAEYFIRARIIYPRSSTRRYGFLLDLVYNNKIKTILEIGVYNGRRAVEMITTAGIHHRPDDITYLGFDLFEEMDDEIMKNQLSKRPDTLESLKTKIGGTGARVELFKGFSEETLPKLIAQISYYPEFELVFIDGGHAVETIRSDWKNVEKLMTAKTIVVFDDYYIDRPDLTGKFGCNNTIDSLKDDYQIEYSDQMDSFEQEDGILKIRMVKVAKR